MPPDERPRVLFVINTLGQGGAEEMLLHLSLALGAHGYECHVAALSGPYTLAPRFRDQGIPIHELDLRRRWDPVRGVAGLTRLTRRLRPVVVHGHLPLASAYVALGRLLDRYPIRIATLHSVDYRLYPADTCRLRLRRRLHLWAMRRLIAHRVAVSDAVARHYGEELGLSDLEVIPNGIPPGLRASLPPDQALGRLGIERADGEAVIVCAARLEPEKNPMGLLAAFALVRAAGTRARLVIAGDGSLATQVRARAVELGVASEVFLLGCVPHEDLLDLLAAADVVALASLEEGHPLVALESLAVGTPVVGSRVGGLPEIIDSGATGLLVPPGDHAALADAIEQVLKDRDLREALGDAGPAEVTRRFGIAACARRHDLLYRRAVGRPLRSDSPRAA